MSKIPIMAVPIRCATYLPRYHAGSSWVWRDRRARSRACRDCGGCGHFTARCCGNGTRCRWRLRSHAAVVRRLGSRYQRDADR